VGKYGIGRGIPYIFEKIISPFPGEKGEVSADVHGEKMKREKRGKKGKEKERG
jgi:hypothetical protein